MYNRYIPNDIPFTRVEPPGHGTSGGKKEDAGTLTGILRLFGIEQIDSGDVLLLLILLFLAREGDDLEVLITLGLALLMGVGKKDDQME